MVEITTYDSWDEAMADMDRAMRAADMQVRPWQEKIAVGDLLLTVAEGEPVFSEVLERYTEPRMRHYRFCRAYSVMVDPDDGELGDIHVATVAAVLTREQFEEARANCWHLPALNRNGGAQ